MIHKFIVYLEGTKAACFGHFGFHFFGPHMQKINISPVNFFYYKECLSQKSRRVEEKFFPLQINSVHWIQFAGLRF